MLSQGKFWLITEILTLSGREKQVNVQVGNKGAGRELQPGKSGSTGE
jgi:hypothetical protein